jgi:cardiolipin synthase
MAGDEPGGGWRDTRKEGEMALTEHLSKLPNQLTAIRFLSVPVMWVFALLGRPPCIGLGLIIGLVTDALDGPVARKLGQVSDFGSKFDSLADNLLELSTIIWILMLKPEILKENRALSLIALGVYFASLAVGLVKFGRFANLHLYLSKAGGVFLYVFVVHAFLAGRYNPWLFTLAAGSFILSSAETLILQLVQREVDEHLGSIVFLVLGTDHPVRLWLERLP